MSDDWSDWDSEIIENVIASITVGSHNVADDAGDGIHEMETEDDSDDEPLIKYSKLSTTTEGKHDGTEHGLSDSSSDAIPLSKLKPMDISNTTCVSYTSASDDDLGDPDFVLSGEEIDTDTSDSDDYERTEHADIDFKRACEISEHEHGLHSIAMKWHTKRLHTLLSSRGLSKVSVPANGDCFIASILILRPDIPYSVNEYRQQVANHLFKNKKHYINFLSTNTDTKSYEQRISKIRRRGHWSDDMVDLFPLAVANMISQPITILTSRHARQVIDIKPSMSTTSETKAITLAYTCIPGKEHYDPCIPLNISDNLDCWAKVQSYHESPSKSNVPENDTQETPKKMTGTHSTTPRKSASYISPCRVQKTRKRIAKPDKWKRNVRKQLRLQGKTYVSEKGNTVPEKKLSSKDCSKCLYQCNTHVSEKHREELHEHFWSLESYERQRDYIASCVEEKETKTNSYKNVSRCFTFNVSGVRKRICKGFFLTTLHISDKKLRTALTARRAGKLSQTDQRGKSASTNKTPADQLRIVEQHIESFPTVSSHYTRKNTQRKYLAPDLSISKMYSLYRENCQEKKEKPVSEHVYRRVFNTQYNLYFFKPKKDQCQFCHNYNQKVSNGSVDEKLNVEYQEHQRRKKEARKEKEICKENAKKHLHIYAATFDLQAVLATPCSLVSQVYYKRKLSTYNLSFYSLGDQAGTCYMWNETHGGRGSSEVGTCLVKHIQSLPNQVKYITLFSDCCTGQNRNRYVASALNYALVSSQNIEVIEQMFLESGHTQMECDSMHASIETAKRKTSIYEPSQWDTIVQVARKNKPYSVVPMNYTQFLDFHEYADANLKNLVYDSTGTKVSWMKIKVLQLRREAPGFMFVKYDFSEEFITIITNRSKQRGRPSISCGPSIQPPRKYHQKLPISTKKKQDLLSLCRSGVIPEVHHEFYENLPSSSTVKDAA